MHKRGVVLSDQMYDGVDVGITSSAPVKTAAPAARSAAKQEPVSRARASLPKSASASTINPPRREVLYDRFTKHVRPPFLSTGLPRSPCSHAAPSRCTAAIPPPCHNTIQRIKPESCFTVAANAMQSSIDNRNTHDLLHNGKFDNVQHCALSCSKFEPDHRIEIRT
jgi:hypothetical protein